jgi:ferredoxin
MPYVVTDKCIACGACVSGCESNAITEGDTQSYIDVNICIECGTCQMNCPSDAIEFIEDAVETVQPAAAKKPNLFLLEKKLT